MLSFVGLFAVPAVSQILIADIGATRGQTESALAGIGRVVGSERNGVLRVELDRPRPLFEVAIVLEKRGVEYVLPIQARRQNLTSVSALRHRLRYFEAGAALRLGRKPQQSEVRAGFLPAYLDWLENRVDDVGEGIDPIRRDAAIAHRNSLPPALMVRPRTPSLQATSVGMWSYIGPKLTDPGQNGFGQAPHSGRKNGIAISHQNPEVVYTATGEGGVWKTDDGGLNWFPLSDDWDFLGTNCVAVNPGSDAIVLAGTGDYDWNRSEHFGIMRSFDGGATWVNVPKSTFGNLQIRKIIWDPESPNTAIALASSGEGRNMDGGIYRTTDWGVTWTNTGAPAFRWDDIDHSVYDPSRGYRTYYAVAGNYYIDNDGDEYGTFQDGNVYKSTDRGLTWTWIDPPVTTEGQHLLDVACSRLDPDRLYLLCPGSDQIFRSNDGGATWNDKSAGFPDMVNAGTRDHWDQDGYDLYIETSYEGNSDLVFVGLLSIVGSPDGGNTWFDLAKSVESTSLAHADQHCMAVDPTNPRFAYVGGDGGIYHMYWDSTFIVPNLPLLISFVPRNSTLYDFLTVQFSAHPTNSDFVMAGHQDMGTQASRGNLADWTTLLGGDGGWSAFELNQPRYHYVTTQRLQSIDAFTQRFDTTATAIEDPGFDVVGDTAFVAPLIVAGATGSAIYVGANRQVWTYDRTAGIPGWTQVPSVFADLDVIEELAYAPSNPAIIFAGNNNGKLFRYDPSIPGAALYEVYDFGDMTVGAIAVHPTDPDRVLVGLLDEDGTSVWECFDVTPASGVVVFFSKQGVGTTLPNTFVTSICYDPFNYDTWYAGTDEGLYKTVDAGLNWTHMTAIPNAAVSVVAVGPGTFLYAATRGRGVWRAPLFQIQIAGITPGTIDLFGGDRLGFDVELRHFTDREIRIRLRDNSPDIDLPDDIPVPPGLFNTHVEVPTLPVAERKMARIEAEWNGTRVNARVNLYRRPPIAGFEAMPSQVTGGQPVQFRVGFANRLPANATIEIDDNSNFLQAPDSIVIPKGERFGVFMATTSAVPSPQLATVRVRFGTSVRTTQVAILP